jgi:hypothetical protein
VANCGYRSPLVFFHFLHLDLDHDAPTALTLAVLRGVAVGWVASVFGVAGGDGNAGGKRLEILLAEPAPTSELLRLDRTER